MFDVKRGYLYLRALQSRVVISGKIVDPCARSEWVSLAFEGDPNSSVILLGPGEEGFLDYSGVETTQSSAWLRHDLRGTDWVVAAPRAEDVGAYWRLATHCAEQGVALLVPVESLVPSLSNPTPALFNCPAHMLFFMPDGLVWIVWRRAHRHTSVPVQVVPERFL